MLAIAGQMASLHPTVPQSTPQYPTVPCRYGDYKLAMLPSLPPLSDKLISIKIALNKNNGKL